ncbi:hypothetical protein HLB23_00855 [Nocardia uniformis]|uniref:Uncharacterized protein n=1 Tax=Nocardia uniformis TaxID=53432 RepID=A0A849BWF3_9NOCA|nr:hypothetical protein [Nocardia uniformis]NNH68445.1 hypothetical protein [Nocardia uniformis]
MRHTGCRALFGALMIAPIVALIGGLTAAPVAAVPGEQTEFGNLCIRAQVQTANLDAAAFARKFGSVGVLDHTDADAFAQSKPHVRPLTTMRFDTVEPGTPGLPKQVRCKGKSADSIALEYGTGVVGGEGDCAKVNRQTLTEVANQLWPFERDALVHQPGDVVIDADQRAVSGPDWLLDFPAATKDAAGRLHLQSKSLYVPVNTPGIPEEFKGQHYCTLAAHSYVKRLLLGQAQL